MSPRLTLVAGAALLLAACQSSASPSVTPSPSPTEAAYPFPSGMSPLPSLVGNPELEATLPTSAAGLTFFSFSMSGPDFVSGDVDQQFLDFLDRLNADIEDVSVAFAIGSNPPEATKTASIFAFQVAGAEAQNLTEEFKASAEQGGDPLVWHEERIGGKSVQVADPNADFPTPIALYATGDVLYFVSSSDDQALQEILSGLP